MSPASGCLVAFLLWLPDAWSACPAAAGTYFWVPGRLLGLQAEGVLLHRQRSQAARELGSRMSSMLVVLHVYTLYPHSIST